MIYLYVLYNSLIDKFYIGCTNNIERRLIEHNSKNYKVRYTSKQKGEWVLMYKEEFKTLGEARTREREIKSRKSKKYIKSLIGVS